MKLKTILLEIDSDLRDSTFLMYHGGTRWSRIPSEIIGSKQGRYEAGVGIYFTNSYETARKYAKGGRVVHAVSIDKNFKLLKDVRVNLNELVNFVKSVPGMKKKSIIVDDLKRYAERTSATEVSLEVLNNLLVNHEAGAGKAGVFVSNYFVSKGADAYLENQSGEEFWLVVFNPKILKKMTVIDPKTVGSGFPFILPKPNAQ